MYRILFSATVFRIMSIIKPVSILFLAQTCVGINIVLSKGIIDHINPIVILTIRFTLASIFITFLLLMSKDPNRFKLNLTGFEWFILIVNSLGTGVLFNLSMLSGLHFTDATSTGLITSLLPAIIICINIIFFKQKLTAKIIVWVCHKDCVCAVAKL